MGRRRKAKSACRRRFHRGGRCKDGQPVGGEVDDEKAGSNGGGDMCLHVAVGGGIGALRLVAHG